jgi:hypothetical protein
LSGVPFAFYTTIVLSSPALPLYTPTRASLCLPCLSTHPDEPLWLVWCYFLLFTPLLCHRRLPYLSTHPDEPLRLVWGYLLLSTWPLCRRRRLPYLSTHLDEPLWLVWCSFCFPHSHSVIVTRLTSPHTQTGPFRSSGIVVPRFTSPHIQTSLFGSSGVPFALHTAIVSSSPTLPLHTPTRASLRLPYLSTHPDEPLWLVWCYFLFSTQPLCRRRPPYLSTHPDEPLWLVLSTQP